MAIRGKRAKKLTKAEQKHLTESGISTLSGLQRQVDWMRVHKKESGQMACWTCCFIAKKLGLVGSQEVV